MALDKCIFFVPLQEEMDSIISLLKELGARSFVPTSGDRPFYQFKLNPDDRQPKDIYLYSMDPDKREAMGNIVSCARTSAALVSHKPTKLFLIGIAGSMDSEKALLGDVVVSDTAKYIQPDKLTTIDPTKFAVEENCYSNEYNPDTEGKIVIHPQKIIGNEGVFRLRRDYVRCENGSALLQKYFASTEDFSRLNLEPITALTDVIGAKQARSTPQVLSGDILGSEWVVDNQFYIEFIKNRNSCQEWDWYTQEDALNNTQVSSTRNKWQPDPIVAVDMETYGFLKAVDAFNRWSGSSDCPRHTTGLAIRGISDLATNKAELDGASYGEVRHGALRNALRVAVDILKSSTE